MLPVEEVKKRVQLKLDSLPPDDDNKCKYYLAFFNLKFKYSYC